MMVSGPEGVLYIRQDKGDTLVEDKEGNELFRTEENSNVAIQWAINYLSSVDIENLKSWYTRVMEVNDKYLGYMERMAVKSFISFIEEHQNSGGTQA